MKQVLIFDLFFQKIFRSVANGEGNCWNWWIWVWRKITGNQGKWSISSYVEEAQVLASFHLWKFFDFYTQKGYKEESFSNIFRCTRNRGKKSGKLGICRDELWKYWKTRGSRRNHMEKMGNVRQKGRKEKNRKMWY